MSIIVKGMEMPENCTRCDYIGLNVAIGHSGIREKENR